MIRKFLSKKVYSYNKLNFQKWLLVQFKINHLSKRHLAERYFDGLHELGISDDGMGMDYFIHQESKQKIQQIMPLNPDEAYTCLAIGAAHYTKQIPIKKCVEIVDETHQTLILLGGKEDIEKAKAIENQTSGQVINLVGKLSIEESAAVIDRSQVLITGDTGMMHIAAALKKPIILIWGSTEKSFGMYPYYGKQDVAHVNIENNSLNCRPCTKIGRASCPKGHMDCMNKISSNDVIYAMNELIGRNFK